MGNFHRKHGLVGKSPENLRKTPGNL